MKTLGITTNELPLSGRTVLVTGAAKRLGARDCFGCGGERRRTWRLLIASRRLRRGAVVGELAQHGVEALAVRCDVTDEKSVREMVKEVARELGGIDVLVNNAANYEKPSNLKKITVAQWDAIFCFEHARDRFWCRVRHCHI